MGTIVKTILLVLLVAVAAFGQHRRLLIAPKPSAGSLFPTDGLVAYWPFDEEFGVDRDDYWGTNTFVQSGTVGFSTNGLIGTCLTHATNSTAYLYLANIGSVAPSNTWTFGGWVWFNADSMGQLPTIWGHHFNNIPEGEMMGSRASGRIYFNYCTNGTPWSHQIYIDSATPNSNTWYLCTWGLDTNTLTMHLSVGLTRITNTVAGISTGKRSDTQTRLFTFNDPIGEMYYRFSGQMDEWFWFNRILTDSELSLIYNSGAGRRP